MKQIFKRLFCKHKYIADITVISYDFRDNGEVWEEVKQYYTCCECGKDAHFTYWEKSEDFV